MSRQHLGACPISALFRRALEWAQLPYRHESAHFQKRRRNCNKRPRTMDPLLISAASGMKSRMDSLDMLANNLANTGTTGFKADKEFYGLYQNALPMIERHWTDFSQGDLVPTANPLHLGLDGKGLFALNSPNGILYTRNGEFQISRTNQL